MTMFSIEISGILKKDGRPVIDERGAKLLNLISKGSSLALAAKDAGLSYYGAKRILTQAAKAVGDDLVETGRGRRTRLTKTGRTVLREYENRIGKVLTIHASGGKMPLIAVDGIILHDGKLVVVKRRYPPYKGMHALPGGIVEYGERLEDAIIREIREETGLLTRPKRVLGVYSDPERDPRGHVISIVFEMEPIGGALVAGDDASELALLDLKELPPLAFDHSKIVSEFLSSQHAIE